MDLLRNLILTLLLPAVATAFATVTGDWHGSLDLGAASLRLVLHITPDGATMDSPDQGAKDIPMDILYNENDSVALAVPRIGFQFSGRTQGNTLQGTIRQMGNTFPITLEAGGGEQPKRPQTPPANPGYATEEVTFGHPGVTLAGTLTLPDADPNRPVVVMVSGSGLQDRDETIFEHKPFAVLAHRLAGAGIPSLRYDDRSVGGSSGDVESATTADFAADTEAAINFLRNRGFKKIGILGHSEGGMIAFMEAARGKADFIITLGAPGVRGDSILVAQINGMQPDAGLTVEKYRELEPWKGNAWMEYFVNYDPAADIAATRVPALVLAGEKDTQVDADTNAGRIRRLLPGGPHTLIKTYPGLNHLMQPCTTGAVSEYSGIETTIDDSVIADILGWLLAL